MKFLRNYWQRMVKIMLLVVFVFGVLKIQQSDNQPNQARQTQVASLIKQTKDLAAAERRQMINDYLSGREEFKKNFSWAGARSWLAEKYLLTLPLILVLYCLWWYNDQKKFKISFRNFGVFIAALIFYPLIVIVVLINWMEHQGKAVVAEAEIRKFKHSFFAILSQEEKEAIKEFAEGKTKWHGFRESLSTSGIIRHTLLWGLIATLIATTLPDFSLARERTKNISQQEYGQVVSLVHAPLANSLIEKASPDILFSALVEKITEIKVFLSVILVSVFEMIFLPQRTSQKIEHVPLC